MKKHIPNLFTAINLLSGWCSVYFAFQDKIGIALLLIVFAAFFDLMDGFAARLLKVESLFGAQFDSFADLFTFGIAPATIVFNLVVDQFNFTHSHYVVVLFLILGLIPVNAAIRLVKFNLLEEKTSDFIGLPSPAFALAVVSITLVFLFQSSLLEEYHMHYTLLVLLLSFTMVTKWKFMALKFVSFDFKSNKWKYLLMLFAMLSFILLFMFGNVVMVMPIIILLYFIFSILNNYTK